MMLTNPPVTLVKKTKDDMGTFGILVQLFCALKAGIFILWYFFSNNLTKTRKVKEMMKQSKYFKGAFGLYLLLALCAFIMQIVWVIKLCDSKIFVSTLAKSDTSSPTTIDKYRTTLLIKVVLIWVVYMICFSILSFLYYVQINKFTTEMESFHLFLTTYRQTPRSRFIRKY